MEGQKENKTLEEVKEERQFLHSVASPLGTAVFVVDALLERLHAGLPVDAELLDRVTKAQKSLDRVTQLLQQRRALLIERGQELEHE